MKNNMSSTSIREFFNKILIGAMIMLLAINGVMPYFSNYSVYAAETFTINDTDSYGSTTNGIIYQFDGTQPSSTPKASLTVTGELAGKILNGLAVDKNNGVFYVNYGQNLYTINPDGSSQLVTTLTSAAANAAISADGTKYLYNYGVNGKYYIGSYDLNTKELTSAEIKGSYSNGDSASWGGDLLVDNEGYIWVSRALGGGVTDLLQIDPNTYTVLKEVEITSDDPIEFGARGLSFLPSGQILMVAGNTNPTLYLLDKDTVKATYLGAMTGPIISDLASGVTPSFNPSPDSPILESEKTSSIAEKADGNTDAEHPEVGDTLSYVIQARNTVENSPITNLSIKDSIPDGLEYISGSLKLDGQAVSDAAGDDGGQVSDRDIIGQFGDVTDTEWHKVEFQVKVQTGQAGSTIQNTATVSGDNIDPQEPSNTVEVVENPNPEIPDNPNPEIPDACAAPVALINGGFEEPTARNPGDTGSPGAEHAWMYFYEDEVPGWETNASDDFIQIMNSEYPYNGTKVNPPDGDQYAELNANQVSALYQDVETNPGQTIYWRLAHRGGLGEDTMAVQIGSAEIPAEDLPVIQEITTGNTEWKYYSGSYKVPAGQTTTRFAFNSVSSAQNLPLWGNLLDDIFLGTEPCIVAEKSIAPEGDVFEGDELTYEVTTKNTGGDVAADAVFEDAIPEGTEYVPGSMKLVNGSDTVSLTDEDDDDAGVFDGSKVRVELGDVQNTTNAPDGITVQFKVKALSSHAGETIANKANIQYQNLLANEEETTESNEVTTNILENPEFPDACAAPVALINGSFEQGPREGAYGPIYFDESEVPGWSTTDDGSPTGDKVIEIWNYETGYPGGGSKNFPKPPEGVRYAELNAYENGMLYQDVETTPGQTLYWRLSHMGRAGVDTMQLRIGAATDDPYDTAIIEQMSDGNTAWGTYTGSYTVPAGQTVTRFGFEALSSANGSIGVGNFLDDIFLGTSACVVAEKTVAPEGQVNAGDELTYEVTTKNNGGDIAADTVFEDAIPEGTEYVPGSMKLVNGSDTVSLTDADDDDAGVFDGNKVRVELGDVQNTTNASDGITVQFKVKALSSHVGKTVANKANIQYQNLLTNESKTTESNEVNTPIGYKDPVTESDKSFSIAAKADGNTDAEHAEVGDTLTYKIQTRNTIEDSLIQNLNITDTIPEGLEYIADTLKVDGEAVTDEEDEDKGQAVNGDILGTFGDVTDTEWHTVEFQVKVLPGQASKDIQNVATVAGDNLETPDKPEEEVNVYPRIPDLESEKTAANLDADKDGYEVGDTVVYTIKARNPVSDSLVEDFVISDELPEGLSVVDGSLEVSDGGSGSFEDGKFTANFGDVADTEWRTVTFQAKIESGQSGKRIENVAAVTGSNIDTPDEPKTDITVDPKDPITESDKSFSIAEKGEGNTDAEHAEVGDTLTYKIQTRNTIEDSLIQNLNISDTIPEGLEYSAGTLKVDGEAVTDEEDEDKGQAVNGDILGTFGDVTDTEWHTVEFQVKVMPGQASKDIQNVATVSGDNLDTPDKPEEVVKVYPRIPVLESNKTAANLDPEKEVFEVGDTVVYTIQTRNTVSDSLAENLMISDVIPAGLTYVDGSLIVSDNGIGNAVNGTVTANFGNVPDTGWRTVTFQAKIESGQSGNKIENIATVTGSNIDKPDEPKTDITVDPKDPVTESDKSFSIVEKGEGNTDAEHAEVGDTLTYKIQTRNTIEDSLIQNLNITDTVPEGLEYVADSLKVDGEAVTDEEDEDKGQAVDGDILGTFGDISDTEWHTVEFQVTVLSGQAGKDIQNVATVSGDNLETPDKPEEEVKVYPRVPVLESEKTAANLDADKEGYEVGDTIVYTIKSRNTVSDSLVENFVISDELPEGLSFVDGSLEVSDGGSGSFEDGKVTANFGDVADTEWRTVTFQAKIESGQSSKKIENVASVTGSNIDRPDEPKTDITVDPKDPKLESDKSFSIVEKGEGNTDAEHAEVGDTLTYKIQTRNTIEDSLIQNLNITDTVPEGLEYVADTLKVDGEEVTDAADEDKGQAVDGDILGAFGDITDTEWHTVEFQVTVLTGQAGKDIQNVATVSGDNLETPDKPEEEVKVYPRVPVLESEKTAANLDPDKEVYEAGDTVVYTIQSRNTVSDSLVENFVINDELPEGLSFVDGSLEMSDGGKASFEDGKITASFGDVTDTEWRTVTFQAKIESGQSGKKIENVASVTGGNIGTPDEPKTDVTVDPKDPKLESEKTAKNLDADKEAYEVGDMVVYTIKSRNTVSDSLVENFVINDELPEGLSFVDGSLETSEGGKASFEDGKVTASFGYVTDTEWRTVTFQAKIESGQSGKKIENVASVTGGNIETPDEPKTDVTVDPKDPKLESEKTAKNLDADKEAYEVGDMVVYTIQSRNTVSDSLVENFVINDELPEGLSFVDGSLEMSDGGKASFEDGKITASFGDVTDTEWRTVTFQAKIESGQSGKKIENVASVTGGNIETPDEPKTDVTVDPKDPKLESEKTAKNLDADKEAYESGDTIVYTIKSRNTVSDSLVENFVITDELPEGLSFVDGSLETSEGGKASFEDGKVTASFGDVTDTEWHTVTFQAKIESGYAGKHIENVATVSADNIDTPDKPNKLIDIHNEITETPDEPSNTDGPTNTDGPNKPNGNDTTSTPNAGKPSEIFNTNPVAEEGQHLPKTASNIFNLLIAGIVLLVIGLSIRFVLNRKANN
ncbi:isopeptide-forming domain-containing fimbrial protein [Terribacillus aidingensis]|uniref:isopeptide-forming domain-containing fimbrial protein n=1 Tax=Terribacillus aidingensis TaxID=586416 RepID=UPI0034502F66